jgi:glycerol-3-phosphate O-acyltransferase
VRWLLESFREIPGLADNIVIVPVMTSYERLFETGNLTNEMIKNERQLISLKEVLQKFVQMKND